MICQAFGLSFGKIFILNFRQRDAINTFKNRGYILTSDYIEKYKITDRTARRDLFELVEKGFLNKTGSYKNTKYLFKE